MLVNGGHQECQPDASLLLAWVGIHGVTKIASLVRRLYSLSWCWSTAVTKDANVSIAALAWVGMYGVTRIASLVR